MASSHASRSVSTLCRLGRAVPGLRPWVKELYQYQNSCHTCRLRHFHVIRASSLSSRECARARKLSSVDKVLLVTQSARADGSLVARPADCRQACHRERVAQAVPRYSSRSTAAHLTSRCTLPIAGRKAS